MSFLVLIRNMVSIVRVWLVLSLNLVLWLYLIVDYGFNFLSRFNGLFYYTIKFLMFFVWSSLFYFFTSPYNLFVFQSTNTNWRLFLCLFVSFFFFFNLLFITLYWFFSIPSLSLSPLATYRFPKFDDDSMTLNMHY